MALNAYRRHRRECPARHPEESRSGEFEERKKGWKRCDCPIFVSGTLGGKFKRQNTGNSDWVEARAFMTQRESIQAWEGSTKGCLPTPELQDTRITIVDATDAYIASCANRGVAIPTLKKYKTFVKQLRAYSDSRGYVILDQLKVADMDCFYASWKDAKRAKAKKLDRLKSFIKFCLKRDWLTKNIADDLRAPEGSSVPANKMPFTDEEVTRILTACDVLGAPTPRGPGYRPWSGEDAKDFILLSVYTGLRISDVATFNVRERLNGNDVFTSRSY
jgi:hypothetical protein